MPAPGSSNGADREADGNDTERNSLAAEAQQSVPFAEVQQNVQPADATQIVAAGITMVTAGDIGLPAPERGGSQNEILEPGAQADPVLAKLEQSAPLGAAPAGRVEEQTAADGSAAADAGKRSIPVSSAAVTERVAASVQERVSAVESERVVLAKAGTAADNGPELSRLSPMQAVHEQHRASASQQPAQTAAQQPAQTAAQQPAQTAAQQPAQTAAQQPAQTKAQQAVIEKTGSEAQQDRGAAVPGTRQTGATAEGFVAMPVGRSPFQSALATPATEVKDVPAEHVPAATPMAVETASQVATSQGGGAILGMQDEAQQAGIRTGATEGAQKELAASVEKGQAPAATESAKQQPVQVETARVEPARTETTPDTAPVPDSGAQSPADRKDARAAEGPRSTGAAEKGAVDQAGVTQKVSTEEASGIKTASANAAAKFVPSQGGSGQQGSGDADKKGHPEQKAPGSETTPVQPMGVGAQTTVAEVTTQQEAKPVQLKGALHESILSQVKDGVITHDGKGNGKMSITLNPGELGELKIQVRMEDNRLRVEVQADNRMVKDLLMSNLDSLKEALSGKNFTMEGFDVSTGGGFNSPLSEERGNPRQQSGFRSARAGGYATQDERRVNYLTADVNNLLDVRF
ncbi:MAG: hypothetical protein A2075_14975 [Geobacteraceae bacterium GWC2_58_44]|nr:MAG: hypothetical protein A2075_14975 [Geobacteraceae bacterium GWC2_58_44]